MKSRSRKNKGVRFQNQIAEMIRRIFKFKSGDVKPAIMGEKGVDIHLSSYAQTKCPLLIECKNQEKLNIWKAIEQAQNQKGNGKWTVFFKRNHSGTYVVLDAEWFLEVLNEVTK